MTPIISRLDSAVCGHHHNHHVQHMICDIHIAFVVLHVHTNINQEVFILIVSSFSNSQETRLVQIHFNVMSGKQPIKNKIIIYCIFKNVPSHLDKIQISGGQ